MRGAVTIIIDDLNETSSVKGFEVFRGVDATMVLYSSVVQLHY